MLVFTTRRLAISRSVVVPFKTRALLLSQARTYATNPENASRAGSPTGASQESSQVNQSRGAEHSQGSGSQDTKSVQTPVSNPGSDSGIGHQEEGSPDFKNDPKESDGKKREKVEQLGQKPLDPADK
ncbi:hypothetical protein LTR97_000405 [Elasticomyces elasticus]|uniref:Uncharacterized protein n=1 Tax=Elasticomyces elasticus TaxID=574655 RepID=A0AAN7WR67_9PEZI|nr:hypothetical protein LTR97_000405 [Elasticomyces elasticus]